MEVGTGKDIGIGIEMELEGETDLETGVAIEAPDIVVGIQGHNHLNVYSVLYSLIYLVLLNSLYR